MAVTERHYRASLGLILALGAGLRLHAYLANRSLWVDEAMLALNVVTRSFGDLLAPLDAQQLAPIGFLFLTRLAVILFGSHELALRLVPFLASLVSLPLMAAVARAVGSRRLVLIATGLLAVAPSAIYFAQEFKQYSSDVAMALLLLWPAMRVLRGAIDRRGLAALALCGSLAIWVSRPAVLVAAAAGVMIAIGQIAARHWRWAASVAVVGALWGLQFLVSDHLSLRSEETVEHMLRFWGRGFLSAEGGTVLAELRRYPALILGLFTEAVHSPIDASEIGMRVSMLLAATWTIGCVALWRRQRQFALLLMLTLVLAVIAALLQRYPLTDRFTLYLLPVIVLGSAAGISHAWGAVTPRRAIGPILLAALLVLPAFGALQLLAQSPRRDEIKPLLTHLARACQPEDRVWVYYGASPAYRYYTDIRHAQHGNRLRTMHCAALREEWDAFRRELELLRGHPRVWFVFTHVWNRGGIDERRWLLTELDRIGQRADAFHAPGGWIYRYDLSDDRRASGSEP